MICMYSKAHCTSVGSMTLSEAFTAWRQCRKVFRRVVSTIFVDTFFFYTHSKTALVLHSLSSTQSEVFSFMAQVPCIVNERMYKLKTQKLRAKECNLDRYQVTFREPFVKIPTIINFPILQHILCLPHQLFQYLLKYITASVERVCSPWANYSSEP